MSVTAATAQPATLPAVPETVTGAELLGDLPPVNERAVAALGGATAPAPAPVAAPVQTGTAFAPDAKGRAFDPKVFRTLADGSPYRHPKTRLFMPRGGRKPKALAVSTPKETGSQIPADLPGLTGGPVSSPSSAEIPASTATQQPAAPVSREEHEASAEGILRGAYAVADSVFSAKGEWQPEDEAEHAGLRASYVAWSASRPSAPLSPGWGFVAAVIGYVAKRLQMPNTLGRLAAWFPSLFGTEAEPQKPEKTAPETASKPTPPQPDPVNSNPWSLE